ncbi:hypothetical protein CVT24_005810 [Panaeolus cyanescens]|uniref:Pericentrin/AKAP-450 centrosomal targeting domain-containing protein n=1 Tax=Panaeolus cyanescens TaxID=181874 RepID=A0A409VB36_9AGAR|nr:hypothetical protein CVT24_005810 [Panaeolus cyanescens]
MAGMLETPSRIWRRIEAIEDRDMPSLPSLPSFDGSAEIEESTALPVVDEEDDGFSDLESLSSPVTSTPASHHTATLTGRVPSSTSSTARFANSIASRSNKSVTGLLSSKGFSSRRSLHDSFEVPSLPRIQNQTTGRHEGDEDEEADEHTKSSVPDVYLPPDEDKDEHPELDREYSLTDALESISRSSSPSFPGHQVTHEATPKKNYDYSMSLRSEPKVSVLKDILVQFLTDSDQGSPFNQYRNVSTRKPNLNVPATGSRTPSLSRTSSSQTSSPSHSTPQSNRSISIAQSNSVSPVSAAAVPLPRSRTNSPAIFARRTPPHEENIEEDEHDSEAHDTRSMDITDVHISPPRLEGQDYDQQVSATSHQELPETSNDEKEPTFSSDEGTTYGISNRRARQVGFNSPSDSLAFTPTPAFPRPRARFDLPSPPSDPPFTPAPRDSQEEEDEDVQPQDDLMTPHTRRRSFLLSVINSTARPRLKLPTPHPRRFGTPGVADATPGPTPYAGNSQGDVTIGLTPRPRVAFTRRGSHPLSQAITASSTNSSAQESSRSGSISTQSSRRSSTGNVVHSTAVPTTPGQGQLSPYVGDRASFISTASSHDLTTHQRMNTSFDPAMGFGTGAPGHGVGRFNAGKLNNYLHGLNRRLQEENELLLERLRKLEEDRKDGDNSGAGGNQTMEHENRRHSGGSRRSSVGTSLGNVQEDVAEGWLEEKAELEEMLEAYKVEVDNYAAEKEEMEKLMEMEREERHKQEMQWREKMLDVEKGVQGLMQELQDKVTKAEEEKELADEDAAKRIKELEKEIMHIRGERDVAIDRASKAEKVLEGSDDIGAALHEANDRIGQVMGDLRNANTQMQELEEELVAADAKIEELEKQLAENDHVLNSLEEEIASSNNALSAERTKRQQLEDTVQRLEEEIKSNKAYTDELEEGATAAVDRVEKLESELAEARDTISKMTTSDHQALQDIRMLEEETAKAQESAKELQEALEEAEQKMVEDEEEIASLKSKIASLERERQRDLSSSVHSLGKSQPDNGPTDAEYQALEEELEEAHKELARLNALLNESPARRAVDKAKDLRIDMLLREKEELVERNKALRLTFNEMSTPHKVYNTSNISPIHRQVLNMSIKAPRTPGAPLRDMSWLHTTTAGDQSASPLLAEIQRLQRELDRANESIDDKLDKLEDAGMGVVGLTKKLEDARAKIALLEDEISRLTRKEDRRSRRLARARCQKCHVKVDLRHLNLDESSMEISRDNLPSEPPTPPTKTSEALKANLQAVNKHLEELQAQWEIEKQKLLGEKAVLEDATNRLNTQVKTSKEEARKALENNRFNERNKAGVQSELEKARQTIAVLETELGSERARLRSMVAEQEKMQREKKQILTDMQRTESDIDEVKQQLQKIKKENNQLEKELRGNVENANVDQKARILEARVVENADTIEQLRQERSLLAGDYKDLQKKFADVTEAMNGLRKKYSTHSTTHENRKHELDMHRQEIDDLRRALDEKANDLERVEKEKIRIATEKGDVARTVAALEADLRRVKRDAEAFGKDLKILRAEKEQLESKSADDLAKAERAKKQSQAQIRLLAEQLEEERSRLAVVKDKAAAHVCTSRSDEKQISQIKLQHNKECKGLMVQIRYLKAKFVRESLFRNGLAYQKHYLLVLLGQFEKSERTIFASIARIGFPVAPPAIRPKPRKLKSVALMVIFLSRTKRARENWKEETAAKQAIADALQEVRKKRAIANI